MEITLKRIAKKPGYTIGKLYINGTYFCDTLEDTDRGLVNTMPLDKIKAKKVYSQTAIPTGTYKVQLSYSPKFCGYSWAKACKGLVPEICSVPGFSGVRIHPGNEPKDTLGCILVGQNKIVGKVINSQAVYRKLFDKLRNVSNIKITIL